MHPERNVMKMKEMIPIIRRDCILFKEARGQMTKRATVAKINLQQHPTTISSK